MFICSHELLLNISVVALYYGHNMVEEHTVLVEPQMHPGGHCHTLMFPPCTVGETPDPRIDFM